LKNGKRYRYYLGTLTEEGKPKPWRLPAHEIESAIVGELRRFLADRQCVAAAMKRYRLQTP